MWCMGCERYVGEGYGCWWNYCAHIHLREFHFSSMTSLRFNILLFRLRTVWGVLRQAVSWQFLSVRTTVASCEYLIQTTFHYFIIEYYQVQKTSWRMEGSGRKSTGLHTSSSQGNSRKSSVCFFSFDAFFPLLHLMIPFYFISQCTPDQRWKWRGTGSWRGAGGRGFRQFASVDPTKFLCDIQSWTWCSLSALRRSKAP